METTHFGEYSEMLAQWLSKLSPKLQRDFMGIEENLPSALMERFPHAMTKLNELWPSSETFKFLDQLLLADRADRAGFPAEVIADLTFLRHLHEFLYPETVTGGHLGKVESVMYSNSKPRTLVELVQRHGTRRWPSRMKAPDPMFPEVSRPKGWGELETHQEILDFINAPPPRRRLGEGKLGQILVANGLVSVEEVQLALDWQKAHKTQRHLIGHIMVREGLVHEYDVRKALCVQENIPMLDLDVIAMMPDACQAISASIASQYECIPVLKNGKTLVLAMVDPLNQKAVQTLALATGLSIRPAWATPFAISRRLRNYVPGRFERRNPQR